MKTPLYIYKTIVSLLLVLVLTGTENVAAQSPDSYFVAKTVSVPGNLKQPLRTGIQVGFDDYVYIEALGKIRVGLFYGSAYPVGLPKSFDNFFNKRRSVLHGALMWQIGPESGSCRKMFRSYDETVKNIFMVSEDRMIKEDGPNYVAGDYFLSKSTGELMLDINDNDVDNNSEQYQVRIFVLKQYYHVNRNQFNHCPLKEPGDGEHDRQGNGWIREWPNSWVYHGFNNSYRGTGKYSGCQCVYDRGTLLRGTATDTGNDQGSFDFGFWLGNGDADNMEARHLHLILDVLPHDLWVKRYGGNNKKMRYSPPQVFVK
ncbi:hypothetical protein ACS5NO_03840 [Larkinella sp. GY13]|uniref:hypothetical protein n=1 Tax=Larkinella sp. GY13 TaxID=3453720 RepID=UPI003EEA73DA